MKQCSAFLLFYLFMITVAAVSCLPDVCNHTMYIYAGDLISPNYPKSYLGCTSCTWSIRTLPLHKIKVIFEHFDLEEEENCKYDNVTISGHLQRGSGIAEHFCGKSVPHPIISSENMLTVTFIADQRVEMTGFKAKISAVLCGGNIREDTGKIITPHYPDNYPGDKECIWTIAAQEKVKIQLRIEMLMKSATIDCSNEYLEIRDGQRLEDEISMHLCGNSSMEDTLTSSNHVLIRYVNKVAIQNMEATISFNKLDCTTVLKGPGLIGFPNNIDRNSPLNCSWTLLGSDGNSPSIEFKDFKVFTSDNCSENFLVIFEGENAEGRLLSRHCGQNVPPKVQTSSNSMFLRIFAENLMTNFSFSANVSEAIICGGKLHEKGQISSPNFPFRYADGTSCTWMLETRNDNPIVMNVTFLKLISPSHCVQIYDVVNEKDYLLRRICGNDEIPSDSNTFYSTMNKVKVTFDAIADSSVANYNISLMHSTKIGFLISFHEGKYSIYSFDNRKYSIYSFNNRRDHRSAHVAGKLITTTRPPSVQESWFGRTTMREIEITARPCCRVRLVVLSYDVKADTWGKPRLEIWDHISSKWHNTKLYRNTVAVPDVFTATEQKFVVKYVLSNDINPVALYYSEVYK